MRLIGEKALAALLTVGMGLGSAVTAGPPTGACCFDDGSCEVLDEFECDIQFGDYQGNSVTCVTAACQPVPPPPPPPLPPRMNATQKGSLLIFPKVDIRWDDNGVLLQDTFISLTNDFPEDVRVQLYFVNGDSPLEADGAERAHPGWNYVDNAFILTGDQPTYWSTLTGQPATGGLAPFTALDPGFPPGRPAPDGGRMLRGFIIVWAVRADSCQRTWNHLSGAGTIINYGSGSAWEYNAWSAQRESVFDGFACGRLSFGGGEYDRPPSQLLMNFQAVGSAAFSGPRQVISDTDLTLLPVNIDLRQEGCGPTTTKANFNVWNMNEVKFSGAERCITCWDQTLLSAYDPPNHFRLEALQTAHGKARIDGLQSQVCDVDFDPNDGPFPTTPCTPQGMPNGHPDDVVSQETPLVGVVARLLSIDGGVDRAAAATNLIGLGAQGTRIRYDLLPLPPEAVTPTKPAELLDRLGYPRNVSP